MDKHTAATAASLIRLAVKYMDEHGWNNVGAHGVRGEVCPVAAVIEAARVTELNIYSDVVFSAVYALDDAARGLPADEKAENPMLNDIARYNEHPKRNSTEVKNFMGNVANRLVNPPRTPKPAAPKKASV